MVMTWRFDSYPTSVCRFHPRDIVQLEPPPGNFKHDTVAALSCGVGVGEADVVTWSAHPCVHPKIVHFGLTRLRPTRAVDLWGQ